jgi:uncharacterized protein involved in exopolysaccharide biosynthesis
MNNEPQMPPERSDELYDQVDFAHYASLLWRYRLPIVLITLVCGLAAFTMSLLSPRSYEATVKLVVTASKLGAANESAPTVSVATFRAMVQNQAIAANLIEEFGLNRPPHEMTPSDFISQCVAVESPRDTNIIVVTVRLWDPALAAKVANRLAQAAQDLAQQLNQRETVTARDIIKTQLDQSQQRLERAGAALETFRRKAQIELLRKDVDALLGQRGALLSLLVDIQAEKARLSQAEALLKQKTKIETLMRSIDTDPAAMEAVRKNFGEPGSILPLQLRNEVVNPVYESLDQVVATSQTRLAGLEKQRSELVDVRKLDQDQQAKLSQLYQDELELSQLQTEYDLARAVYVDVATRYEQARLQVAGRSALIDTMDAALPPDRPVSRRVVRNTALVLIAAFMLAAIAVLFLNGMRNALRRDKAAAR